MLTKSQLSYSNEWSLLARVARSTFCQGAKSGPETAKKAKF